MADDVMHNSSGELMLFINNLSLNKMCIDRPKTAQAVIRYNGVCVLLDLYSNNYVYNAILSNLCIIVTVGQYNIW